MVAVRAATLTLVVVLGCASNDGSVPRGGADGGAVDSGTLLRVDAGLTPPRLDGGADGGMAATCSAPRTSCGGACVDTSSDLAHCGGCDAVCAPANATPSCSGSRCAIASCNAGFADCDGRDDNGCERDASCTPGVSCVTACDSMGTLDCGDVCAPSCTPPAETCNGVDDDCNGQCDDGPLAGCRVPVHRSFGAGGHLYTRDLGLASGAPYSLEREGFFHLYGSSLPGTAAFYRCRKSNGKFFLTTSAGCEGGGTQVEMLGHVATDPRCGSTPLYRLFLSDAGNHFYATTEDERDYAIGIGYVLESVAGHVWRQP